MDREYDHDVIVVGGGFAGVIAGRDISEQGHSVLLLEARDRLGGRTWTRSFADTDLHVEIGGEWIEPQRQINVMKEIERYDIAIEHSPAALSYPTLVNGHRLPGPLPIPPEEIVDLERAIFHAQKAAARIETGIPLDHQGLHDLDVSWDEFIEPLDLPPATRDYLSAIVALYMSRYTKDASALHLLAVLSSLDLSAYLLWGVIDVRFRDGTKSLIDAITADSNAEVRLETPVARVEQDEEGVSVTTEAGTTFRSRTAVIAMPMNCWNDVHFDPPLSQDKQEASAERHGSLTVKYYALVENGIQYPFMITGTKPTNGLICISTEYELPEGQVMVGFACDPEAYDPNSFEAIQRAVGTFMPDANVLKFDAHDWNNDPYSKGDWVGYRPGRLSKSHSKLSTPEGRLHFATSDIAQGFFSWMEGAVEMGHRAAGSAMRVMAREAIAVRVAQ
jgi:monoamine oxidase